MTRRFFNRSTQRILRKTRPKTIWIGTESAKGYERADFDDAFRRYLLAAKPTTDH